ncbi:MAG: deoxyadenosine/deoxycytidine kinase [Sphingobacteriales bacterium]|jgi:deoxyadenosine/deoxycytidine kinase
MHIAIAGNIGAGKTTLTAKLSEKFGWKVHDEPIENNPYLNDFYQDMKRWSFNLQIYFLNNRFINALEIAHGETNVIQDRTIYEDAYIFAANLHDMGLMNTRDYENYQSIFNSLKQFITPPDLLIFLQAGVPTLVKQIQKRGREYEKGINVEYLEQLNLHYEKWVRNYDEGKLLMINVEDFNFAESVDDFEVVAKLIEENLNKQKDLQSQ